jgi:hypothetical protein
VGKPNERERDLLFSFRKVHISNKTTFPAKENTSQHQICPTEICLVFHAKIVPLSCLFRSSFFVPTVHCTDCSVWPKKTNENLKIASKTVPKIASISVQIRTAVRTVRNRTDYTDPYSAHFPRKMCPLCCSLSSLKLTQKISLTPSNVLSRHSTCLAHYPMHSFII